MTTSALAWTGLMGDGRYKIFINPSVTEVLCTTVAEALAMGKWVICPEHPSNEFFRAFPNCLQYRNSDEFAAALHWALNNEPPVLLPHQRSELSWDAAMDRLTLAARPNPSDASLGRNLIDRFLAGFYKSLGTGMKGDFIRFVSGGGNCAPQVSYARAKAKAASTPA